MYTSTKDKVSEIRVGNELIELTARPTERAASGWSVAAFTSAVSLRSTKVTDNTSLLRFANAICAACDDEGFIRDEDVDALISEIETMIQA